MNKDMATQKEKKIKAMPSLPLPKSAFTLLLEGQSLPCQPAPQVFFRVPYVFTTLNLEAFEVTLFLPLLSNATEG